MKIIDAHLHLFADSPRTRAMAAEVGHDPHPGVLGEELLRAGIVGAVVMGNGSLDAEYHTYPAPFSYCVGLDRTCAGEGWDPRRALEQVEENFRRPGCVGLKLYPGYNCQYLSDPMYAPFYALARDYEKPVAIHMGMTSFSGAKLKYSHPLTLDEVAADWPQVSFVMCHFGNPFLADGAAVLEKNPNVWADLSGLLVGVTDLDAYFLRQGRYVEQLRCWMEYVDNWEKFLFGTDFPGVNIHNYVEFIARLVPECRHEAVFYENARRVYGLEG